MSTRIWLASVMGAALLAGCGEVRLPGSGDLPRSDTGTTETPASVEPADPGVPTETVSSDPAPQTPAPTGSTDPVGAAVDPDPASASVQSLIEINAALCGLPVRPVEPSPTLAELTGAQPEDTDRVGTATINGAIASLADFPGLVKMEPREILPSGAIASGHCGATRIAETWFITAAHCLDDDYDEVDLILGSESLSSPLAKRVKASVSVCHAAYGGSGNNYVNDIALVRVDESDLPALANLPIANYGGTERRLVPFNYAEARMAGWGLTAFRGSLSDRLLTATLKMTGTGPAAIGVLSQDGAGPCVGDSGGPLFVSEPDGRQTVVGVLSVVEQNLETREFCAGTYGARYTNLQGYEDWITGVISACENGLGLCGY